MSPPLPCIASIGLLLARAIAVSCSTSTGAERMGHAKAGRARRGPHLARAFTSSARHPPGFLAPAEEKNRNDKKHRRREPGRSLPCCALIRLLSFRAIVWNAPLDRNHVDGRQPAPRLTQRIEAEKCKKTAERVSDQTFFSFFFFLFPWWRAMPFLPLNGLQMDPARVDSTRSIDWDCNRV